MVTGTRLNVRLYVYYPSGLMKDKLLKEIGKQTLKFSANLLILQGPGMIPGHCWILDNTTQY
jgi:hypothetical protein